MESDQPILDVRPAADFQRSHRIGAVNIPLEELARRIYELPPPTTPVTIFDLSMTRVRWARSRLRARNRRIASIHHGEAWLRAGPTAAGTSTGRLWQPHPLLVEALKLARTTWPTFDGRCALDLACGTGRDAVFLALNGLATEAWDVLPDAITRCRNLAKRNGVSVATQCRNIETDPAIDERRYDLVTCFNFLHRPLMPHIARAVRPGGFVAYQTFVHPHRALFAKPGRDAHLLNPGELPTWFADWQILLSSEGLTGPRRFAASLVARKPPVPSPAL